MKNNLPPEGSMQAIFVTRTQRELIFVLPGSTAAEVPVEELPEQIQLW